MSKQLQQASIAANVAIRHSNVPRTAVRTYLRFNIHQRLQHFLMAFSFLGLVATGLPMFYSDLVLSRVIVTLLGGIYVVGIIHRTLGVVMIISAVYHAIYLAVMYRHGYRAAPILFNRHDWFDFCADVLFCLGLRRERPRFGRYSWFEKFDYFKF